MAFCLASDHPNGRLQSASLLYKLARALGMASADLRPCPVASLRLSAAASKMLTS